MDRHSVEYESERPVQTSDISPAPLPPAARRTAFIYLGGLTFLVAFADPNGGLMDIPVSFFLKNKLHLEASEVARFRGIESGVALAEGFLRHARSPGGLLPAAQSRKHDPQAHSLAPASSSWNIFRPCC